MDTSVKIRSHHTGICNDFQLMAWDGIKHHYNDVIMGPAASQITSLTIVYTTVYSGADQRKHQSSVSLAFVWGIHRWPVNSPHKWPVTRKMFPLDDVIMIINISHYDGQISVGRFKMANPSQALLKCRSSRKWHQCLVFSFSMIFKIFRSG